MKGLTKRQLEVLQFINTYIDSNSFSPSYREIQDHFGFASLGAVSKHVQVLERKGRVAMEKNCSRSLSIKEEEVTAAISSTDISLPLMGTISAEQGIKTFKQIMDYSVAAALVPAPQKTYVLQAEDNSFQEEMVIKGDYILLEVCKDAMPGQSILGNINEESIFLKKYYPESMYIRLVGHHPLSCPMIVKHEDLQIRGVVVGLIRSLQ